MPYVIRLLGDVLARFEEENGSFLLVATLCLLEVSMSGLLESELLNILSEEENLMPPSNKEEKGESEKGKLTSLLCEMFFALVRIDQKMVLGSCSF